MEPFVVDDGAEKAYNGGSVEYAVKMDTGFELVRSRMGSFRKIGRPEEVLSLFLRLT